MGYRGFFSHDISRDIKQADAMQTCHTITSTS